jgi:hypothetical protein
MNIKTYVLNNSYSLQSFLSKYAPLEDGEKIWDLDYHVKIKGEFPHYFFELSSNNTSIEFAVSPFHLVSNTYGLIHARKVVYYFLKYIVQNFLEYIIYDAHMFNDLCDILLKYIDTKEITKKKILWILLNLKLNKKLNRKERFQEILHRVLILAYKIDNDYLDYLSEDLDPDSLPEEYLRCLTYPAHILQLIFYYVDSRTSWKELILKYSLEQWTNLYNIRKATKWKKLKMLINKNYEIFMNISDIKEAIKLRRNLRKLNEIVS